RQSSDRRWSFGSCALIRTIRRSLYQRGPQFTKSPLLSKRYIHRKLKAEWLRCANWPTSGARPRVAKATARLDPGLFVDCASTENQGRGRLISCFGDGGCSRL